MSFAEWYTTQFRDTLDAPLVESDGIPDSTIVALLDGTPIPESMREYYRVAGKHWMNSSHNRLYGLDFFERIGGHTIFMEENQCVVQWSIPDGQMTENDPVVFVAWVIEDNQYEWTCLNLPFSRFIIEEWRETLTGGVNDGE